MLIIALQPKPILGQSGPDGNFVVTPGHWGRLWVKTDQDELVHIGVNKLCGPHIRPQQKVRIIISETGLKNSYSIVLNFCIISGHFLQYWVGLKERIGKWVLIYSFMG